MSIFRRVLYRLVAALVSAGLLSACGGSHGTGPGAIPGVPNGTQAHAVRMAAAVSGDVIAINAGGSAAGGFSADTDFSAPGTWAHSTTSPVDTSTVTNPAPQAVYQTQRTGGKLSYTIPGLTAGAAYTVKLSFAELYWSSAGQRTFNIGINNATAASNFDVFATAGARNKAVVQAFAATADSTGSIAIVFTAVKDNATVNAIEISAGGATPAPTSPPGGVAINSGGSAAGGFAADADFVANGSWTSRTAANIVTTGITNPAPAAVYQSQRVGSAITYTIPGLTAGAVYTVRLHFAEIFWTAPGRRVFNVGINGSTVLTNFDIFAAAGGANRAVVESFSTTANSAGAIAIALSALTNYSAINGIEVTPGGSPPTPTPTPTSAPPTAFDDWPTYGYDSARSGFNPNTGAITPGSIANLRVAWQTAIKGSTQTQPIVVTNVAGHQALLIIGNFAVARAYDALTGALVWQTTLPTQDVQDCGLAGISGTAQYDRALSAIFMAAGNGGGAPNHTLVYRLDAATGKVTGQVDVTPTILPGEANYSHSGVTLANGRIYIGTGSDCEGTATGRPSWRGRVVAVDPSSMTLLNTFFTTYGQGGNFGGGGVWGWGGVSADPSGNIYVATGNAETNAATGSQKAAPPFVATDNEQAGYAEHLVKLSGDLSTVESSNYPGFDFTIGHGDLDYAGTPVIYSPPVTAGCGTLSATQGKGGQLVINNTQNLAELNDFKLSVPSSSAYYIGNPAYSPNTGYVYAAISSSGNGSSLLPPGLAAIGGCGSSIAWHAQFGPDSTSFGGDHPRSAPTVTAGGVVFMATPCGSNGNGGCGSGGTVNGALWAVDGTSGSVLGGGKPLLITADSIRMAPSADGSWLWLLDGSGNLYGLTVDPSVKAVATQAGRRVSQTLRIHAHP